MRQRISILICYYNSEKFICRALKSLLNQGDVFVELILVDNNSSDSSNDLVTSFFNDDTYLDRSHLFTVKIIKEKNQGLAYARNAGFDLVTCDYVYILDSDNQLMPGILPLIVNHISDIKADCYFLKNNVLNGKEMKYNDNFDKFWNLDDFFSVNPELTPIFSREFIRKHKYFEQTGVKSELPILLYLNLFKYKYTLFASNIFGQIYDNNLGEHERISTASLFSKRSYAGLVQRHQTLMQFKEILPYRVRIKIFFEYVVFYFLCLYLGYYIGEYTLKALFSKQE